MIICDKCNKKIELKLKVKKHSNGIEEVYFKCPHCKERYVSYFTDKTIRAKQKKINKLWKEYRRLLDEKKIVEKLEEIDVLKTEIKVKMDELKRKMKG